MGTRDLPGSWPEILNEITTRRRNHIKIIIFIIILAHTGSLILKSKLWSKVFKLSYIHKMFSWRNNVGWELLFHLSFLLEKKLNNCYVCCQMVALLFLAFLSFWSVFFWNDELSLFYSWTLFLPFVESSLCFFNAALWCIKKKKSFTNSIYSILVVFLF